MEKKVQILAFVGSLRKGSFHRAIAEAAVELAPEEMAIEIYDGVGSLPLFDQDNEMALPADVVALKEKVLAADAILFVTPEYNYSVPGVLKNLIDWVSRPYGTNAFAGKPAAVMSGSVGMVGGARSQYHLRQMGVFLDLHFLNQPEVMVPMIQDKVKDGKLVDENTKAHIRGQLEALAAWTRKIA